MFLVASMSHVILKAEGLKPNCVSERFSHLPEITQLISSRVQEVQKHVCSPQCPLSVDLSSLVCYLLIKLSVGPHSAC